MILYLFSTLIFPRLYLLRILFRVSAIYLFQSFASTVKSIQITDPNAIILCHRKLITQKVTRHYCDVCACMLLTSCAIRGDVLLKARNNGASTYSFFLCEILSQIIMDNLCSQRHVDPKGRHTSRALSLCSCTPLRHSSRMLEVSCH